MRILKYFSMPAEFRAYDPVVMEVARLLGDAIQDGEPRLQVEHIGSTSVPDCGGKGIIDLAILYPEGLLACARTVLDGPGFPAAALHGVGGNGSAALSSGALAAKLTPASGHTTNGLGRFRSRGHSPLGKQTPGNEQQHDNPNKHDDQGDPYQLRDSQDGVVHHR